MLSFVVFTKLVLSAWDGHLATCSLCCAEPCKRVRCMLLRTMRWAPHSCPQEAVKLLQTASGLLPRLQVSMMLHSWHHADASRSSTLEFGHAAAARSALQLPCSDNTMQL